MGCHNSPIPLFLTSNLNRARLYGLDALETSIRQRQEVCTLVEAGSRQLIAILRSTYYLMRTINLLLTTPINLCCRCLA